MTALGLMACTMPTEAPPAKRRRLVSDVSNSSSFATVSQNSQAHNQNNNNSSRCDPRSESCKKSERSKRGSRAGVHETRCEPRFLKHAASPPYREDDEDGHYNFDLGENLTSRYKIVRKVGEGTFGRVLECWDRESKELVAIKVIRSAERYREAAMIEVDVLHILGEKDSVGSRGCVQIRRWFDYRNHICIVFEKLGPSLFDFLRYNDYRPFSIDIVREFGKQLLESVAYMHGMSLIHTDLKPENILLVSSDYTKIVDRKNTTKHSLQMKRVPKSTRIKVIDFGSTTIGKECSYSIVSTRHYRAPEVILGSGWSYPCDIWSVGCILVELCSGEVLFQTHENLEHLAMMERVLGPIPTQIVESASDDANKFFKNGKRLNWPDRNTTSDSIRAVHKLPRLRDLVMEHVELSSGPLVDLLEQLLKYDPKSRPTAKDALNHPFFKASVAVH